MSSAEDKIVGLLRKLLGAKSATAGRNRCPDEEVLSQFLAGKLAADARSDIEGHLAHCSPCAETLVAAYKAAQPGETARAPQWLVARAMALVPAEESLFDLSVRLLRKTVELISTSGQVVPLLRPVMRWFILTLICCTADIWPQTSCHIMKIWNYWHQRKTGVTISSKP